MRKWLILLALAVAAMPVSASTTTFSATLKRGDGTVPKVFLRLSILNCGDYVPFVNSDHIITNPDNTFDLFPNTSTGVISAVVDDEATIKCGTSTGVAYYHIDTYQGDQTTSTARRKIKGCDYDITGGSFNMNATACKAAGTVAAPINAIQNVDNAGSLLNNRGTLNFFNGLQAADNAGSNRTDISPVYGAAANTVTQGNDSRVTGAAQVTGGDLGGTGAAPTVTASHFTDQTSLHVAGLQTIFAVASDFTTAANTSLQNITGLSWTAPANTALKIPFECHLLYSQGTGTAAVAFGLQDVTVAPTSAMLKGQQYTSATVVAAGNVPALTTTTATNIVSATPSAITTVWNVDLDGYIEQPSNASTSAINIMVSTATSGDPVTVKRGSFCKVF